MPSWQSIKPLLLKSKSMLHSFGSVALLFYTTTLSPIEVQEGYKQNLSLMRDVDQITGCHTVIYH